jgi:hypothetical protein
MQDCETANVLKVTAISISILSGFSFPHRVSPLSIRVKFYFVWSSYNITSTNLTFVSICWSFVSLYSTFVPCHVVIFYFHVVSMHFHLSYSTSYRFNVLSYRCIVFCIVLYFSNYKYEIIVLSYRLLPLSQFHLKMLKLWNNVDSPYGASFLPARRNCFNRNGLKFQADDSLW